MSLTVLMKRVRAYIDVMKNPVTDPSMTQPPGQSPGPAFVNAPADGCAIRARGIRKTYTGAGGKAPKQALADVDLDIPDGAILYLAALQIHGKKQ